MPSLEKGGDFDNRGISVTARCWRCAAWDLSHFGSIEQSHHQHNFLIRLWLNSDGLCPLHYLSWIYVSSSLSRGLIIWRKRIFSAPSAVGEEESWLFAVQDTLKMWLWRFSKWGSSHCWQVEMSHLGVITASWQSEKNWWKLHLKMVPVAKINSLRAAAAFVRLPCSRWEHR